MSSCARESHTLSSVEPFALTFIVFIAVWRFTMVKRVENVLEENIADKLYKDALCDVMMCTAVMERDIDPKVLQFLDHLQQHGKAEEACSFLKTSLEGVSRDQICKWRAYVYTLLKVVR